MYFFKLEEFEHSETAERLGIDNRIKDNEVRNNIIVLVDELLDKVRGMYEKPIYISSGYRCPELNRAIGGVRTSQHCKGEAADLVVDAGDKGLRKLVAIILNNALQFDQLIWEEKNGRCWLHVSYRRTQPNRNLCMIYDGNEYTIYDPEFFYSIICDK